MRKLLFALALTLFGLPLPAQLNPFLKKQDLEFSFIEFGVEDGLPNPGNFDMIIDQKGRIWASTFSGLVCYNGGDLQTYTQKDGLPFNQVLKLFEDSRGRIWMMGFEKKLYFMDDQGFHPYAFNQLIEDSISTKQLILGFSVESSGDVYLNFQLGTSLVKIDSSGRLTRLDTQNPIQSNVRLLESEGIIHPHIREEPKWLKKYPDHILEVNVSFSDGLGDPQVIPSTAKVQYNRLPRMECAIRLQDGRLLINTRRGLIGQLEDSGNVQMVHEDKETISLFQDSKGWVYEGTFASGVYIYGPSDLKTPMFHWFPNTGIAKILEDKEGGIWLATRDQGWKYCPNNTLINLDITNPNYPWQSGMDKWGNKYRQRPLKPEVYQIKPNGEQRKIAVLRGGAWTRVFISHDYSFVALIDADGVRIFDPETNVIRPGIDHRIRTNLKNQALSDSLLFFASSQGVVSVNRWGETSSFQMPVSIQCALVNSQGEWFVGNSTGLYRVCGQEAERIFPTDTTQNVRVYNIEGNGDTLFAATDEAGILVLTKDTLFQITEADGFPDNITLGINPVDQKRILAGSRKGIALVSPFEKQKVKALFNPNSGLLDMGTASGFIRRDTCILTGPQYTGIIAVADLPEHLPVLPPPHLSVAHQDSTFFQESTQLEPGQNELLFSFYNVSYQKELLYKYQLKGFDPRWYETENREIRYPNLPPGRYTFQVESRTIPGYWSGNIRSWSFEIATPFWATWWFRALGILCILAIGYWLARKWVQRERRRLQWKQRMIALKNEALRSQMNPHFTFNAMNSIQSFITGRENEKAANYLSSFARLIRMFLELSRSDAISLEQEISLLDQYLKLEEMRFPGQIQWSIECDPDLDKEFTFLPSLMVQPLVENAVLHGLQPLGKPGWIRIRFSSNGPDLLTCTVWDNGVGKSVAQSSVSKQSLALSIVKERLDTLHQSGWSLGSTQLLYAEEVEPWGKGTVAILNLPLVEDEE